MPADLCMTVLRHNCYEIGLYTLPLIFKNYIWLWQNYAVSTDTTPISQRSQQCLHQ